jgi:hypothetical protein
MSWRSATCETLVGNVCVCPVHVQSIQVAGLVRFYIVLSFALHPNTLVAAINCVPEQASQPLVAALDGSPKGTGAADVAGPLIP